MGLRPLTGLAWLLASFPAMAAMDLGQIKLPPGFGIEVYAEVPNARSMALGDNGVVFVGNRQGKSVYAIVPAAGQRRVVELADGLDMPNGIAYHDGDLYVAEVLHQRQQLLLEQLPAARRIVIPVIPI